jgi:hypothetical protein
MNPNNGMMMDTTYAAAISTPDVSGIDSVAIGWPHLGQDIA